MTSLIGRNLFRMSAALCVTLRPVLLNAPALIWSPSPILIQGAIRNYAARKGTRARREAALKAKKAAKKEKEAAVPKYIQRMMAKKMLQGQMKPLLPDDSDRPKATDNVFIASIYKWPVYDVKTAIQNVKEVHHPTMFDNPKAMLKAYFQLNLSTKKKTQFVERVEGIIELPHQFDTERPKKTVCLFCKDANLNAEALKAGAEAAVGIEGVKMFQEGSLDTEDYDVILSHPDIVNDLAPIRGLISKKFPNIKKGTVAFDVVALVKKFKSGVDYNMTQNMQDPKLGLLHVPIGLNQTILFFLSNGSNGNSTRELRYQILGKMTGNDQPLLFSIIFSTVSMDVEKIEENFAAVVTEVSSYKPNNVTHRFIDKGAIISEHSNERFQVDIVPYLDEGEDSDNDSVKSQEAQA